MEDFSNGCIQLGMPGMSTSYENMGRAWTVIVSDLGLPAHFVPDVPQVHCGDAGSGH